MGSVYFSLKSWGAHKKLRLWCLTPVKLHPFHSQSPRWLLEDISEVALTSAGLCQLRVWHKYHSVRSELTDSSRRKGFNLRESEKTVLKAPLAECSKVMENKSWSCIAHPDCWLHSTRKHSFYIWEWSQQRAEVLGLSHCAILPMFIIKLQLS